MFDRLAEPGNTMRPEKFQHWTIEGTTVPIYDHEGEPIKNVPICWEWCNHEGSTYEICDVRYGSIDGVILPEICDMKEAIAEKMGLHNTLILPDKFHHDLAL